MGDIHHQKIHLQALYLSTRDARMMLQSLHFMDRDSVNKVGLARHQGREASGILGDFAKDNFFDRCFAAPIVVVARENHVAAALETDKFVGTGAD